MCVRPGKHGLRPRAKIDTPDWIRTSGLGVRSASLYPLSYGGLTNPILAYLMSRAKSGHRVYPNIPCFTSHARNCSRLASVIRLPRSTPRGLAPRASGAGGS